MQKELLDLVQSNRRRVKWDDDDAYEFYEFSADELYKALAGVVKRCAELAEEHCDTFPGYQPHITPGEYILGHFGLGNK